jgi:hypothetical protein
MKVWELRTNFNKVRVELRSDVTDAAAYRICVLQALDYAIKTLEKEHKLKLEQERK